MKAPRGMSTRPMADKIKEASFSVLASLEVQPRHVLDLYAGSGSVGIEALSRGAESADFVEQNAAACAVIRDNLSHVRFESSGRVHQSPVAAFVARVTKPYDFIIMDPPYADTDILATLDAVGQSRAVKDGTVLLIGHWPRLEMPEALGPWQLLRSRCHGDSCFSIYEVVLEGQSAATERTGS